ncbi:MAG: DUF58 domain-containing protein [Gemmataceae bacterium]
MVRWGLAAGGMFLIGLVLESSLLVYAAYVLAGLLLSTRWLARTAIEALQATRTLQPRRAVPRSDERPDGLALEIGERVRVCVVVRNTSSLPVPWVLIEDALPGASTARRLAKFEVKGQRVAIESLAPGGEVILQYTLVCLVRGLHAVGPVVLETGDLFGLHRRFRVLAEPKYLLVYPHMVPLNGYELISRRPIGEVRMTHRLFEDPTRIAGVREYQQGDPLSRVHWKVTARTGALHCKVLEPSTLSGLTVLLDFHTAGYSPRGEPMRSELAVTIAASLIHAVYLLGQQVGLVTNARDAAQRVKTDDWDGEPRSRQAARNTAEASGESRGIEPMVVPTGRGDKVFQQVREVLARAELTTSIPFSQLITLCAPRLPRDATALAILPEVTADVAIALGNLRRRGMAVSVVLVMLDEEGLQRAYKLLRAEGIHELRHCPNEQALPDLAHATVHRWSPYDLA